MCYVLALAIQEAAMRAVNLTWGAECDGIVFFVDKKDYHLDLPQVDLNLERDGDRQTATQKEAAAVLWLADSCQEQFDWFVHFRLETYVFLPNLRRALLPLDAAHNQHVFTSVPHSFSNEAAPVVNTSVVLSRGALLKLACRLSGCSGLEPLKVPVGSPSDLLFNQMSDNGKADVLREHCESGRGWVNRMHPYLPGGGVCSLEPVSYYGFDPASLVEFHQQASTLVRGVGWQGAEKALEAYIRLQPWEPPSNRPVKCVAPTRKECEHGNVVTEDQVLRASRMWKGAQMGKPRILCYVLALARNLKPMRAVNATWGCQCDSLIFFMDKVVEGLDLEQVALGIWLDGVAELKGTVIRKSVAAVKWLAAHRAADFDWFGQFNTDAYMFMPNLRRYLLTFDPTQPFLIGRRMSQWHKQDPSGRGENEFAHGSAYVLSNAALTMLACKLTGCNGVPAPFIPLGSMEDVYVAEQLQMLGVWPVDTRDSCGAERFMPFPPAYSMQAIKVRLWYQRYTYNQEAGMGCCSTEPVSYHEFKNPNVLLAFHQRVQRLVTMTT
eukprot:TRINITY_DN6015_c0_g1_i1.p1 TRINITY_DN6015_c0_g1~~TRINITY_DN6015_c0_g1_i1.p1  ORF type:complete len:551 (-),score=79.34 TRINITY_DN6015_c0_g1_i1:117-1769(-)